MYKITSLHVQNAFISLCLCKVACRRARFTGLLGQARRATQKESWWLFFRSLPSVLYITFIVAAVIHAFLYLQRDELYTWQ